MVVVVVAAAAAAAALAPAAAAAAVVVGMHLSLMKRWFQQTCTQGLPSESPAPRKPDANRAFGRE